MLHNFIVESPEPDAKLPFGNAANEDILCVCPVNVKTNDPLFGFQIFIVLSFDPEAKLPFDNAANVQISCCVWSVNVKSRDPLFGFQILIVLSYETDAKLPFGNVANFKIKFVCPVNVKSKDPVFGLKVFTSELHVNARLSFSSLTNATKYQAQKYNSNIFSFETNNPVLGFQILIVLSSDADAKLPFDNAANSLIRFVWPAKVKSKDLLLRFQICIVYSYIETDAKLPFVNVANAKTSLVCPFNVNKAVDILGVVW